jgi:hypothetical protein
MKTKWIAVLALFSLSLVCTEHTYAKPDTLLNVDVTYVGKQENKDNDIDTEIQRTIISAAGQAGFPLIEKKAYFMFGVDYKGQLIGYDNYSPLVGNNVTIRHNDLPDKLHALDFSAGVVWVWSKDWLTVFRFSPGLHTDFEDISSDDWMYTGTVLAERRWGEKNKWGERNRWGLGATYTDLLGKRMVIPLLRLFWYPGENCFVETTFPVDLDVGYRFSEAGSTGLEGKLQGFLYRLTEDDPWQDSVLIYRDVRVGPFVDYKVYKKAHLRLVGGLAFAQKFEIRDDDNDDKLLDGDMENTWFGTGNFYITF